MADVRIPAQGIDRDELLAELDAVREHDADWHSGHTWSLVYHASDEHTDLLKRAYTTFFSENGLNPLAFQSLRRFEAEVVRMTATMLHGGDDVVGTMTSGGSESILLAVKTYRDHARAERGVTAPRLLLPETAHPAFHKACHYFDVEVDLAPLRDDLRVDVDAMARLVTDQTIALVGSAPNYPNGAIDPIADIAAVAQEHGIGMHVDACLGGFLLPWVEQLGHPVPAFDFRVAGVTSMSADVHKYGFAAKGASTVLYRGRELRRHQFFAMTGWPGGIYVSPTAAGTRPGGAIAAAWAALRSIGEDGYLEIARTIMDTTAELRDGITAIDGMRIVGDPDVSVFAFTSDEVDIYAVGDQLDAHGWHMDRQVAPASLHLMVTPVHAGVVGGFLADLAAAVDEVRADPGLATQGQAAMYGMMASVPDGEDGQVHAFLLQLLDGLYDL